MSDDVRSEDQAVPGVWTTAAILVIMGFVGLCAGGVWWLYPPVRSPSIASPTVFPAPRLEVAPTRNYRAYLSHQRALLAGGNGRLPIEDAMAVVARRGTLAPETGLETGQ